MPGDASTPDEMSTAYGRTVAMARATFDGVKPPERMTGRVRATAAAASQSIVRPVPPRCTGSCASSSTVESGGSVDAISCKSAALAADTALTIRHGSAA